MRDAGRRIAITGMGAVSAFGLGAEALWQALRAGTSGIRPLSHPDASVLRVKVAAQVPEECNLLASIDEPIRPQLDRASVFALIAAEEAIRQSGLDFSDQHLGSRSGVVMGTGVGGETSRDVQSRLLYRENHTRVHPLTIVRLMSNAPASQISIAHGLRGPTFVVASACASSNHAVAQGALLIRSGFADVVLVGGTEACLSFGSLRAWEAMRVLADETCRPFSANRRGLVLGEGAAVFVLESWERARSRSAPILAELSGVGMSADAADITAPDPSGAAAAMRIALEDAGLLPEDVQYINAHGTGTQANDLVETRAIHQAFGSHAKALAVSSTKSMHGHALGAAGALELVAVLGALRDSVVPPTINLTEPDPLCDLDYVPGTARSLSVRSALSNSFAFGGLNAVLAVSAV